MEHVVQILKNSISEIDLEIEKQIQKVSKGFDSLVEGIGSNLIHEPLKINQLSSIKKLHDIKKLMVSDLINAMDKPDNFASTGSVVLDYGINVSIGEIIEDENPCWSRPITVRHTNGEIYKYTIDGQYFRTGIKKAMWVYTNKKKLG